MPVAIERFSLERHDGPYERWPLRTRLLADGAPTGILLPAYAMLKQYEVPAGYLLAMDCDCPFEEATTFALVSRDLRLLGRRTFSAMYGTFLLDHVKWEDENRFIATFHRDVRYELTIRDRAIPLLRPRLGVRELK